MKLATGVPINKPQGNYILTASIGAGTSLLEMSVDNGDFVEVPNSSLSASSIDKITLPTCKLRATLAGDAELWINPAP